MRSYSLALIMLSLTACVSAGVKVDQANLIGFERGKTSFQEVVDKLGPPTQTMVSDDGTKTVLYSYYSAQPRPESFIPYVGAFVGGADSQNSLVTLNFDQHDILSSYNASSGAMGAGTGFSAQSQPRNSSQPRVQ